MPCHIRCLNQNLSHGAKELKSNISLKSLAVSMIKGQTAWIMLEARCFLRMYSYIHVCSRRSSRSRFTSSQASKDDVYSHWMHVCFDIACFLKALCKSASMIGELDTLAEAHGITTTTILSTTCASWLSLARYAVMSSFTSQATFPCLSVNIH